MISRFGDHGSECPLLQSDEVRVLVEVRRRTGKDLAVSGANEVRLDRTHDIDAAPVHGQLKAVSENRRLIRALVKVAANRLLLAPGRAAGRERLSADLGADAVVVAGECDYLPVDGGADDGMELRLARSMMEDELEATPDDAFTVGKLTVDADRLWVCAWSTCPVGGRFKNLGALVQRPAGSAAVSLQIRDSAGVVVVDVRRNNGLD